MDSYAMHYDSNDPEWQHVVYVYRHEQGVIAPRIGIFAGDGDNARADARFIAHARQDIPMLLDYVECLKDERDYWKQAADKLERMIINTQRFLKNFKSEE